MTGSWRSSISNISFDDPSLTSFALPEIHKQLQIINDYFRHVYGHPGSAFLSEVSVTKRCLNGTISEVLLLAICALTATVLRYPRYYPAQSTCWIQKAEDLLWAGVESPTVPKTQALLLAVLCRVEMGNVKRGYMLLSLASQSASALRLHYERLDLDHHSQEVRRRLTWSIMLIDTYFSVGLPEAGTCPPTTFTSKCHAPRRISMEVALPVFPQPP
ncbi:fungal-specific transcription factor domain-containing protein [Apiospora kogelbergensis]|uniref:Fungal-specific transcription factor domain-containing protein n=1 Tax=Apiospora kogelbergensis TaxID=1337665 RepID=A0AAW0QH32_9PEZI